MAPRRPISAKRWLPAFIILLVAMLVLWQLQNIEDYVKLASFHAPSNIASLVSDDELTAAATRLLYLNQPQLLTDHHAFTTHCPSEEQAIVLGCYHDGESGVYLYAVSDPQLTGVEQVTAAHEMLHAAYERLSSGERQQVDGWLEDYYQNDLHDPRVLAEIANYKKTEPNDVVNEMHSVFGTEVANLPAPLENYYKRYFNDRLKITTYATNYASAFTNREAQVSQDDAQLASMKATIEANKASLTSQVQHLQAEQATMNQEHTRGDIETYNAAVPGYNAQVDSYNALLNRTQNLITQYNQLVAERNTIALQTQTLQNELAGKLSPVSQQ